MYRVMIVDDEILARVGIKSLISWNEHGFELVGESDNGRRAFELAKELLPDIVITDIKMPVMDGIELMRALQTYGMNAKFIVLSSYDDFQYVKEAMKLGAVDYILKLQLEPEELLKVLKNACNKIENEEDEKKKSIYLEKQIKDNKPILKEKFLKDLISGSIVDETCIVESFRAYEINLLQKNMMCMVIRIENMETHDNYIKDDDIYMVRSPIVDIIEEIISNYGKGIAWYSGSYMFTVIWSAGNAEGTGVLHCPIDRMAKNIQDFLKDSMNLTISIGISDVHDKYSDISRSYKEALEAISRSFKYPVGSIVKYVDIKNISPANDNIPLEAELNELENSIKACNLYAIQKAFDSLEKKIIGSNNVSKKFINGICHIVIFIVNVFIQDNNIAPDEIWGSNENPYNQVERLKVLNDFLDWIQKLCNNIIIILKQDKDSKTIILKAKQFINKHYCEDISLEKAAEHLGLSASYFSRLFSKETGESFIDYVIRLRVGLAKELLKTTKYKVYEVSEMVGYDNPHYFSRIFKKVTGVSPAEYKDHTVG